MGLENNPIFQRGRYFDRLQKIREILFAFVDEEDDRDDYLVCCIQECWEDLYFSLCLHLQSRGFSIHRTNQEGKSYFNVMIYRHGRTNRTFTMHYNMQDGMALQYVTVAGLGIVNIHGSFSGERNIKVLEKVSTFGPRFHSLLLVGDSNMQVRPMSEYAVKDGGMQMDTFLERVAMITSANSKPDRVYLAMAPARYSNFSPRKNVDGPENSDHQDLIAFFTGSPLEEQSSFKHYSTTVPDATLVIHE
jgi:hypothetical protein